MLNHKLLAFKVEEESLYIEKDVICYEVPQITIAKVRSILNEKHIPHFVTSSYEGRTLVCSLKDLNEVFDRDELQENSIVSIYRDDSSKHLEKLLRSALRIVLISRSWHPSSTKLFNPNNRLGAIADDLVDVYQAAVVSADKVGSSYIVFLDAVRKLEFSKTYSELEAEYGDRVKYISWVKTIGTPRSFYIVNEAMEDASIDRNRLLYTASKALKYIIDSYGYRGMKSRLLDTMSNIQLSNLVTLVPKSMRLADELKQLNLHIQWGGYTLTVLPKNMLVPVASMDNITVFGDVEPPLLPPNEKVAEVMDIRRTLGVIKLNGIKFEMEKDFMTIDCSEIGRTYIKIRAMDKEDKEVTSFDDFLFDKKKHRIVCADNVRFYVIPILYRLNLLKGEVNNYDKLGRRLVNKLEEVLRNFGGFASTIKLLDETLKYDVDSLDRMWETLEDAKETLDNAIKLWSRSRKREEPKGEKREKNILVAMIFGVFSDEKEKAELKYRITSNYDYVPILIDVKETVEYVKKKFNSSKADTIINSLEYKINTSLKHKFVSLGCTAYDIVFPEPLNGYKVIGIDATVLPLSKSQPSLGIAVVIVEQNSAPIYHYHIAGIGQNDNEALASAILNVVNGKSIVMVNKENIGRLIDILVHDGRKDVLRDTILVGMTKTHSYSRILRSSNGRYYNTEFGKYIKLNEAEEQGFKITRGLAITTQYLSKKGGEKGTKKTTFIAVAHDMNADLQFQTMMDFLLSLNLYGNISPTWLLSMPWPLHRAHELCENIYRIARYLKVIPQNGLEKL